ncbi:hypothetical protein QJS66_17400 [Kocuria rhizophila]|nr:hypothetical protein QJS66_17400 [Kocuria rhizophila]
MVVTTSPDRFGKDRTPRVVNPAQAGCRRGAGNAVDQPERDARDRPRQHHSTSCCTGRRRRVVEGMTDEVPSTSRLEGNDAAPDAGRPAAHPELPAPAAPIKQVQVPRRATTPRARPSAIIFGGRRKTNGALVSESFGRGARRVPGCHAAPTRTAAAEARWRGRRDHGHAPVHRRQRQRLPGDGWTPAPAMVRNMPADLRRGSGPPHRHGGFAWPGSARLAWSSGSWSAQGHRGRSGRPRWTCPARRTWTSPAWTSGRGAHAALRVDKERAARGAARHRRVVRPPAPRPQATPRAARRPGGALKNSDAGPRPPKPTHEHAAPGRSDRAACSCRPTERSPRKGRRTAGSRPSPTSPGRRRHGRLPDAPACPHSASPRAAPRPPRGQHRRPVTPRDGLPRSQRAGGPGSCADRRGARRERGRRCARGGGHRDRRARGGRRWPAR